MQLIFTLEKLAIRIMLQTLAFGVYLIMHTADIFGTILVLNLRYSFRNKT